MDGDTRRGPLAAGVLLMMSSGIAVVGIGLLMYPVLKSVNKRLAPWYPALRIVEFTVSAACSLYLLKHLQVVPNHLQWVYAPTGAGGLILTYLLFASRLVPRPIAVLGIIGYAALSLGVPLDLLGVLDMNEGPGLILLAPGRLVRGRALADLVDREGIHPTAIRQSIHATGPGNDELTVVGSFRAGRSRPDGPTGGRAASPRSALCAACAGVVRAFIRSPGRPKMLRISAGSSPLLPNQCGTWVSMRLPGRAWLELGAQPAGEGHSRYRQRAVFVPRGLAGHAYWAAVSPFHT